MLENVKVKPELEHTERWSAFMGRSLSGREKDFQRKVWKMKFKKEG